MARRRLLIEPLWNGNDGSTETKLPNRVLLIEPLWNGNFCSRFGARDSRVTSNRTIVEWKRLLGGLTPFAQNASNRTIVEWKHGMCVVVCDDFAFF